MITEEKPLEWVGTSKKDMLALPKGVKKLFGYALYIAQIGKKHAQAKVLSGFGSAGVLEVIEDVKGDTYRAVYTVKFGNTVYVLHCFKKKSKSGVATPKPDIELIKARLKEAEQMARGK